MDLLLVGVEFVVAEGEDAIAGLAGADAPGGLLGHVAEVAIDVQVLAPTQLPRRRTPSPLPTPSRASWINSSLAKLIVKLSWCKIVAVIYDP